MELFKKNKKAGRTRKEDAPAGVNKERGPEPPVMEDMEFETTAFVKRVKRRAGDCGQAAAQSPVPSVPASRPYSRFLEKSGEFRIRQCVYVSREIQEKVADIRFPEPAPCGRTPIQAKDISKAYGSNIVFAGINLAIDKGSRVVILGYNGAGKTTTLRLLAHIEEPDTGMVEYGHGCKVGYFAQEHDTLDLNATVLENLQHVAPELDNTQARSILGSFLFSGDDAFKPASVLSGGEKTRLALATLVTSRANVLLLDEPTNNLDPASREEILKAIAKYEGAIVLVTHDEGAVKALNPERVLLMPDGDEDLWNDEYLDLVAEE